MALTEPCWEVRIVISRGDEDEATKLVAGIRAKQKQLKTLTRVERRSSEVVITRHTPLEYARDGMSAQFHTMQLVWDSWPEGSERPWYMTTRVRQRRNGKAA